jgi:MFS family permease
MSTTSINEEPRTTDRPGDWLRTLGKSGRRAFAGAFGGYGLDAYDFQVLPLALVAIAASFNLSSGKAGLLSTVTVLVAAVGGTVAGSLADRIGRVNTLKITVGTYAVFTVLCGLAPTFPILLVLRGFQGLGFGGEWAVGAALVAEYALPRFRGRTVGFVQSAWSIGYAFAVLVSTIVFAVASPSIAWRVLFITGAVPGLLVLYLRRRVTDAPVRQTSPRVCGSFPAILRGGLGRTTFFAALLATGAQGGYYTLATWLPTYLKTARHLSNVNTGGYLAFLISGGFLGYVVASYLTDLLGRKRTIGLFAVLSGILMLLYTQIPSGANTAILLLSFPLGFSSSAIFSGFGAFLAELYPKPLRATGQGFTYNVGRAVGSFLPTAVGFLAESWGLAPAMGIGALGYAIAVVALFGLPETLGRELP